MRGVSLCDMPDSLTFAWCLLLTSSGDFDSLAEELEMNLCLLPLCYVQHRSQTPYNFVYVCLLDGVTSPINRSWQER